MKKLSIVLIAAVVYPFAGCATSKQARKVEPTSFLGEYRSLLAPGKSDEDPLLVYRNPKANFDSYRKLLLEPVTIWGDPNHALTEGERHDLQQVVDNFYVSLRTKLSPYFQLVDQPGPGVLRAQVALENSERSDTALKVASKGVPYGAVPSTIWTMITGKPAFVGEASIEYILKDAGTGELLAAGADRRVGGDAVSTEYLNSWGDVKNVLDYWTDAAVYRVCLGRGGANCVRPKTSLLPGS
jgi:hypothetical protein